MPEADAWATPLGEVSVDRADLPDWAAPDDVPHAREHACEVQLPFLQRLLADRTVLPLAVGATERSVVADVLDALTATPGTLVVVSTDLSHYHDVATARRLDRRTVDAVVARDPCRRCLRASCAARARRVGAQARRSVPAARHAHVRGHRG